MRSLLLQSWAGFRALLLILVVTPALIAPPDVRPGDLGLPAIHSWEGVTSWYGPRFHGRLTANGEVYDMYASTAAHVTLPLGSLIRVTNPRTGQSKVVRINDRGPYIEGRELDLSYQTARELGLVKKGVAKVRIELLHVPKRRVYVAQHRPQPADRSTGY
jgi:rare lipoprotein A (peptidoglycan hydrolase)